MVKSGYLSKDQAKRIKDLEFRDGKKPFQKILSSYVAPALGIGALAVGGLAATGVINLKKSVGAVGDTIEKVSIDKPIEVVEKTVSNVEKLGLKPITPLVTKLPTITKKIDTALGAIKTTVKSVSEPDVKPKMGKSSIMKIAAGLLLLSVLK